MEEDKRKRSKNVRDVFIAVFASIVLVSVCFFIVNNYEKTEKEIRNENDVNTTESVINQSDIESTIRETKFETEKEIGSEVSEPPTTQKQTTKSETTTSRKSNPTTTQPAIETKKSIPWGTSEDFDPYAVQKELNDYAASLSDVTINNKLTPYNYTASYSTYLSSFNKGSTAHLIEYAKESILFDYRECVKNDWVCDKYPYYMYIYCEENYNDKAGATYYTYYILYSNT